MNDQEGLDQKAIDDLLAAANKEVPDLTPTQEIVNDPQASVTDESVPPPPEIETPPATITKKNKFITFLKALKKQITLKRLLALLGLFVLVITGSAFFGYKRAHNILEHKDPIQKIIQQGITFEEKNFVTYAGYGNKDIVNAFLDTGMSVNVLRSTDGWSPLIAASFYKKPEIVKLLLEKHAAVNQQDKYGKTALMQSVSMGAEDIVKMLLQYGANPNLQDNNGRTALMEAYSKQQAQIAEILKAAGANPKIKPIPKVAPPPPPVKPNDLVEPPPPPPVISETSLSVGKAGFVQIGMPLADIQKKYPTVTTNQRYVNGVRKTTAIVSLNGPNNPSLELELSDSNLKLVSTISTSDEQFLTEKQISIKSTVGDIRSQYPINDLKIIDGTLYIAVKSLRMLFQVDITNESILSEWLKVGNASLLPADIKIKRIIIY